MRALVVDDHEDIAELLAMLLRRNGYEAETAESAPEAIDKCGAGNFDLILSDIGMPGMNGFELVRKLRNFPQCKSTVIIAVTGLTIYDDRKRAIHAGFDEVITKPVSEQVLLTTIAQLRKMKKI
jgi:two-component system CheB/CheR fusion protein